MANNIKYKCAIIGCGNIAGGYDSPQSKNIFTHAHAISEHKNTVLAGVYDISYKKAKLFARKWNTAPFIGMNQMLDAVKPDFIYVSTPTETHLQVLETLLSYSPKAVICEKPLGNNFKAAEEMARKYKQKKIALIVNYTRRFDATTRKIKYNIEKGKYGALINGTLIYTKGILHNGSHAIDLLRYFFGEVKSYKVLGANIDYKKRDPTLDLFLRFKDNKKIHLVAADESKYSIFDADLLFSKARIKLEEFGSKYSIQAVRKDPLFSGYRALDKVVAKSTNLNRGLLNLIDNIIEHIEKGKKLICSVADALKTQETCINLIRKYKIS